MLETKSVLWRIEFRTDASKADALAIPLGYMRESFLAESGRFLGLIFRTQLSPLELDKINLHTWPEMRDLEPFMDGLFDRSRETCVKSLAGDFGTPSVARGFSGQSALVFEALNVDEIKATTRGHLVNHLMTSLQAWEEYLVPVLKAPVVAIKKSRSNANLPNISMDPGYRIAA